MLTDIEIAYEANPKPIKEIAAKLGLTEDDISPYGKYIAKVPIENLERLKDKQDGKLIMVTAITPTPAGEGKTVTSIGLMEGLGALGKNVVGALREPSLGPTFGIKGGATGGGYAQVYPMWDIDLHFTGDIHAVAAAHNLLSAIVDNELVRDNPYNIDPARVVWRKTVDMNVRELRNIVTGLGKDKIKGGVPHESGFIITSASEIAAILCLAKDRADLRARLERIVVAYTYDNKPVTVKDLKCVGAMMVLLKDAINPNLVQTLEGQPVFVHGFPFANIAHGNNSIIATKTALKLADYVVTESGFASDLGGEKFMDIVCRESGLRPSCVVIVATVKALMTHGGGVLEDESTLTIDALEKGMCNLDKHIENMSSYGVPVVVGINHFAQDTQEQMDYIRDHCKKMGVAVAFNDGFIKGGEGSKELAQTVVDTIDNCKTDFKFLYDLDQPIKNKIEIIAKKIYGADGVTYDPLVDKRIEGYEKDGFGKLPICIAKTQASLSDVSTLKGVPKGWKLHVREINISAGAGFIVPECGTLTLMPGLPKVPAAMRMDLKDDGKIVGLK
ncbi:MAG: formate--tetrahydrofolate ligase [Candidatus Methanomethylophilaceae archaeon]|nr:formate--tetrahydrofolate ligase [Candidatus Methanomethylophilaceae archaeon]MBP5735072.1 formate--tetrahydrofolate ligase [Candidatus Methanomethylophilaceae archaeon]